MPKLIIDNQEVEVENGTTVFQACIKAGKEIPHFCFHERLKIAGNCRMCLVEMEKSPKPIASCAMPVADGMVIHTDTPKVHKAREGVMEFLLINHPLDCPICDQGGECDLQDQAFKYGKGGSRFAENKRAIQDKYMGPLIKTAMTRCIHCTRCIRFATEVAGVEEMGALYRGEHMEVTSYLEKTLTSELSGNMIDICPVGALNSKPYAFTARSWELSHTDSIDVMDALGSNIRIDTRGQEVMRILPRVNEDINEEWIADKARFSYDGLKIQRIDRPFVRKDGKLVEVSWDEAIGVAAKAILFAGVDIAAIAGTLACAESMFSLKLLLEGIGSKLFDANQFGYKIDTTSRTNYLFNTTVAGIEKSDLCLLIGANPRQIAPVLNARIGKMKRHQKLHVARIGQQDDQTYKIEELGDNPEILADILNGNHEFAQQLKAAKYPMIIVGDGVYSRRDGFALLSLIHDIIAKYNIVRSDFNGFNILHNHASMVASLDLGFTLGPDKGGAPEILKMAQDGKVKCVYLLGADNIDAKKLAGSFVIYQGHHGDEAAFAADVILPGAAYTEKSATYVNMEGRPQQTKAALHPPGAAKEDWVIIKMLADKLKITIPKTHEELLAQMSEYNPVFANINGLIPSQFVKFTSSEKPDTTSIAKIPINYYATNIISKYSSTMAKCIREQNNAEARL